MLRLCQGGTCGSSALSTIFASLFACLLHDCFDRIHYRNTQYILHVLPYQQTPQCNVLQIEQPPVTTLHSHIAYATVQPHQPLCARAVTSLLCMHQALFAPTISASF